MVKYIHGYHNWTDFTGWEISINPVLGKVGKLQGRDNRGYPA
jgi:hypothetical protein